MFEFTLSEFMLPFSLFLARTLTVVVAVLVCAGGIVALVARSQRHSSQDEPLEVKHLNRHYDELSFRLSAAMLAPKARKQAAKARRREEKQQAKDLSTQPRLFVLDFQGDVQASGVSSLRREVSAILGVQQPGDEVLVRLESPGGVVHGYGLAASQLVRLKQAGLRLTVAVDKVAASGGYMMACVADHIIAAPFAVIGSIGVVAQLPNFHRLLEKNQVDYELYTAGEYKRTLTLFGENTPEGREKFQQQLEEIHGLFKDFVSSHRPDLDLAQVATGEYWYGTRALALKLVDELLTSDDYLLAARERAQLYTLKHPPQRGWRERLRRATHGLVNLP